MKRTCLPITLAAIAAFLVAAGRAQATFHLMQIEQVIGGVGGDATAQAIQLRMRANGEGQVSQGRLVVRDATGANPVTILVFPSNVANETQGGRILIASNAFIAKSLPNAQADFTMTNLIPPGYLAGGSLTFERNNNGGILWRVSWGTYSGSNAGETTNDADGNFGPPFGSALPSAGTSALKFGGTASAVSTNNAADYSIPAGSATFTNNRGCEFVVNAAPACGATDTDNDGTNDDCDACTDTDGDGFGDPGFPANCCTADGCPNDANKTAPGICGCGVADDDADGDGVLNCNDTCANTPAGQSVNGEGCSCAQLDPNADSDGDGVTDCNDVCPNDPNKSTSAGACGCGNAETDTDGDGTPDCTDGCPNDPNKIAPGNLGCGVAEADADGDLIPNSADNCPNVANADQADEDGDGVGDECEAGHDDDGGSSCGQTGTCGAMGGAMLPLLLLGRGMRRRRSWQRRIGRL
ncbi:MAG: hypothetical protein HBSAPP02_05430 [Phycisphaerae bacterium]|nr:MAG: thrombospondin type 3 repeat-containing protein [Planctomycetia bacterium]RIK71806.1 MAG: hypothetical protein DCC66_00800 [Planctomycetota bacterium]GJQ25511.1 MAG: hypothetical protein HBSAPP02_05430 [Phycisphaerae bacterium]